MTDSPDGYAPRKEERLAGETPPASAMKAAPGGALPGSGDVAPTASVGSGIPPAEPAAGGSPHPDPASRGRRRRRRKKKSAVALTGVDLLPAANSINGSAGGDIGQQKNHQKGRKRRRKRSRALQGHPLAGAGKPAAPVGEGASPAAPDLRSREAPAPHAQGERRDGVSRDATSQRNTPFQEDLYAALDLGTNNCRLLIAQPTRPGQFRVVDAFSRIVRLGEGLGATGCLSDGAMERAVEALKICAGKLASRRVRLKRLIATEACRSAANGEEFLDRVRRETGLDLEIVDRETEARLAVAGCSSLVDQQTDALVLFDIGGGSSEIAMIDLTENRSNRLSNHIKAWTSLPVGVVTLSERHGGSTVTQAIFDTMVSEVDAMLESFLPPPLPGLSANGGSRFHLLGTSGTVTTLAGLHLELPRYDRRKVDGLWLSNTDVDRMLARLLSWDFDQRAANPCIGADRADLVLAGCAILESIRKRWPSERMRVADRGLREGLLNEMMAQDGAWRRSGRRRRTRGRGPAARPVFPQS